MGTFQKTAGIFAFTATLSLNALAQSNPQIRFMPENDLWTQDGLRISDTMTEEQFNAIITGLETIYAPRMAKHNAKLVVIRKWSDPTVNAYAQQRGNEWIVTMFGGLARRPEVTPDGFALVMCHELGHHLGGFPMGDWASYEGESDYFGTQSCAHELWGKDLNGNAALRSSVDPVAEKSCNEVWSDTAKRDLCYRSAMAGLSLAKLLANGGKVAFDTKDPKVVKSTNSAHPAAQCRLDTYLSGALCTTPFNPNIIPGKKGSSLWDSPTQTSSLDGNTDSGINQDWPFDQNSNSGAPRNGLWWSAGPDAGEQEAYKYSCAKGVGARPLCWYHPSAGLAATSLF